MLLPSFSYQAPCLLDICPGSVRVGLHGLSAISSNLGRSAGVLFWCPVNVEDEVARFGGFWFLGL